MKKYLLILALLLLSTRAEATQSTINTAQPVQGAPLTSAPVRNNFVAAYNDINNLYTLVGGAGNTSIFLGQTSTTTNPSVAFDKTTGFYTPSAGQISFSSFGMNVGTFSSTGLAAVISNSSLTSSIGSNPGLLSARFGHVMNVVDDCNVLYNGTDQTNNLNACEVLANTAGVCMVFPVGTVTGIMTYNSNDCIIGSSGPLNQTIIKQPNSKNAQAVLISSGSAALWGTNSNAGVSNVYISNITVDGNRANNTSGDCIDLYGYNPVFSSIAVKNCPIYMIRTEYGPGTTTTAFGFEGFFSDIKGDTSGHDGWFFSGPHDSILSQVILIDAGQSTTNTYAGFNINGSNSNGVVAYGLHPWRRSISNDMKYSLWDHGGGGSRFVGSYFEGADTNSVRLDVSNDTIGSGSFIYPLSFAGTMTGILLNGSGNIIDATISCVSGHSQIGFAIGTSGNQKTENKISGNVINCDGGIGDFTQSAGKNNVDITSFNSGTYPSPWVGTPASTDYINIRGDGTGGGSAVVTGGVLTVPVGTAGAPSINFGDATTGFFRPALNQLSLATAGKTAIFSDASQNTYFGDTFGAEDGIQIQPGAAASNSMSLVATGIDSTINVSLITKGSGWFTSPNININSTSVPSRGLYNPVTSQLGIVSNGIEAIRLDASQNVGIGSSIPITKLDVNGDISMDTGTAGSILCLTSTHLMGHCTAAASCTGTCTCTCAAN